jgi:hypothetical protein
LLVAWRRGKRVALVLAAVWCVVLGVGMTAILIGRGSLGQTATPVLLAAVAMLVLPGLTAIALRIDARERRKQHQRVPAIAHAPRDRTQPGLLNRHQAHRDAPSNRARGGQTRAQEHSAA